jgi:hypothetical protein
MVHITDSELSILQSACTKIKAALREDKSSAAQNILKGIIESEQIVKSKMVAPLGGSSTTCSKNLFEMFGLAHRLT